jgi:hypothetical protein
MWSEDNLSNLPALTAVPVTPPEACASAASSSASVAARTGDTIIASIGSARFAVDVALRRIQSGKLP